MNQESKIVSLSATGLDSPGLISKITAKIHAMNGNILDVEEVCRRGLFSIFLIIDFAKSGRPLVEITNDLKEIEKINGLKISLGIYEDENVINKAAGENYIITILGEDQPGIIARVSAFFYQHNVNIENCRMIALGDFISMEMVIDASKLINTYSLSHDKSIERMKADLKDLCSKMDKSIVIQREDIFTRVQKLVVFDVESSLIQRSFIESFVEKIKVKLTSIGRNARFIDHSKDKIMSLIENSLVLKGIPLNEIKEFCEILHLTPGTIQLFRILKSMGYRIALLSSCFNFFLKSIYMEAGVDYAFANSLIVDKDGRITGEIEDPIIDNRVKEELLDFIMKKENIGCDQVIAVGDASPSSQFLANVGLSIAFQPDEPVVSTDGILRCDNIINLLYCLGIPKLELDRYIGKE